MICGAIAVAVLAVVIGAQANPPRQPIAMLGEQAIYEEDLLPLIGAQVLRLEDQKYDLKMKALLDLVDRRLLESAARTEGLTVEAFLVETVDRTVPPPTPAEIEAYYLAHKDGMNRPRDEVKSQLEFVIAKANREDARRHYVDQLRRRVGFSILWKRPRVEAGVDGARLRGDPDAPVTIVEFADFQCPYC